MQWDETKKWSLRECELTFYGLAGLVSMKAGDESKALEYADLISNLLSKYNKKAANDDPSSGQSEHNEVQCFGLVGIFAMAEIHMTLWERALESIRHHKQPELIQLERELHKSAERDCALLNKFSGLYVMVKPNAFLQLGRKTINEGDLRAGLDLLVRSYESAKQLHQTFDMAMALRTIAQTKLRTSADRSKQQPAGGVGISEDDQPLPLEDEENVPTDGDQEAMTGTQRKLILSLDWAVVKAINNFEESRASSERDQFFGFLREHQYNRHLPHL